MPTLVFGVFQVVGCHRSWELRVQEPDESRFPCLPGTDDRHDGIPPDRFPQTGHVSWSFYHLRMRHAVCSLKFLRRQPRFQGILAGVRKNPLLMANGEEVSSISAYRTRECAAGMGGDRGDAQSAEAIPEWILPVSIESIGRKSRSSEKKAPLQQRQRALLPHHGHRPHRRGPCGVLQCPQTPAGARRRRGDPIPEPVTKSVPHGSSDD